MPSTEKQRPQSAAVWMRHTCAVPALVCSGRCWPSAGSGRVSTEKLRMGRRWRFRRRGIYGVVAQHDVGNSTYIRRSRDVRHRPRTARATYGIGRHRQPTDRRTDTKFARSPTDPGNPWAGSTRGIFGYSERTSSVFESRRELCS